MFFSKKQTPVTTLDLFSEASRDFVELCRREAIHIAKKKGTVTIDQVRMATIHDKPEYIDSRIYAQVFKGQFIRDNLTKLGEMPVNHSGPGKRNITIWGLK